MNIYESEIMNILYKEPFVNQRDPGGIPGHSIGSVNKSLRQLAQDGYLDNNMQLTDKGRQEIRAKAPRNAIILAAGFGMRMVPINLTTPKALIEVNGEPLIERTIRQLHEAGVTDITVVVGFMKEQFEYLMDEYGVDLVDQPRLFLQEQPALLAYVANRIEQHLHHSPATSGAPSIPTPRWSPIPGIWSVIAKDEDSPVRVNSKRELDNPDREEAGNAMIGIAYLTAREARSSARICAGWTRIRL